MLARTNLGRANRVAVAGHLDTVPIRDNLPTRRQTGADGAEELWGRGTVDMKGGVAVQLALAAALEIAATVCDGKLFLLGDIGPSGEMLAPLGKGDPEQLYEAFCRQAELMAAYPLDAFLIETVFDLKEAQIILRACLDIAPQIPVLLSLTFSSLKKGGCTMMGNSAAQIAAAAAQQGAAAVGANCGDLTPADYAQVIASMRAACELPLLIQPNAGKPQRQGGEIIYSLAAAEFAQEMASCYAAGARLLGGCCGTTPEHIAALAARYKG